MAERTLLMNKLLVTGISGLVGNAITKLKPPGLIAPPDRRSCDLLRWVDVSKLFHDYNPDYVIHLAAKVGGVKANMSAPASFFMENITMNTHILEAARLHSVKKLICFLSTCVFPDPCPLPLEPKHLHLGHPHPSNYGYAFAKRMLAVQCQTYNEQYGTHFVPVIPCNIYGPNDNFNLNDGHVVPALIRKFHAAKLTGENVVIWGSGNPLREFIFSGDVARMCFSVLAYYNSTEPIILSTGQETSIRELVETIADFTDVPMSRVEFDTSKPEGQFRKPSCNKAFADLVPDFRYTSLRDGIRETVAWYVKNFPNVRL